MEFARWVSFPQSSLSTRLLPSLAVWTLRSGVEGQGLVFEKRPFVGLQGILPALHMLFREDIELCVTPAMADMVFQHGAHTPATESSPDCASPQIHEGMQQFSLRNLDKRLYTLYN